LKGETFIDLSRNGRKEQKMQILTAEIAEHAEGTMAKAQGPGCKGRNGPIFNAPRKAKKPPRGFQERISALSASSSVIFYYLLVLIRGGYEERKIFIPQTGKNNHQPQKAGRTQRG
jgi:hypothetical protein